MNCYDRCEHGNTKKIFGLSHPTPWGIVKYVTTYNTDHALVSLLKNSSSSWEVYHQNRYISIWEVLSVNSSLVFFLTNYRIVVWSNCYWNLFGFYVLQGFEKWWGTVCYCMNTWELRFVCQITGSSCNQFDFNRFLLLISAECRTFKFSKSNLNTQFQNKYIFLLGVDWMNLDQ